MGAPQVHKSLARLSMLLPASYADRCGAGLDTHPKVKRPQAVYPVKKDQYITVLFLQKLKMSSRICTGCELALGSLEKAGKTEGEEGLRGPWRCAPTAVTGMSPAAWVQGPRSFSPVAAGTSPTGGRCGQAWEKGKP